MDSGPQENSSPSKKTFRCCYRDFLYTPRHAELLHLRRKESIQLTARFAALFVLVLMLAVPFWDGAFAAEMWSSQTFILRLLVAGVALVVLTNRAVSARLRRRFPYLPMLMLIDLATLRPYWMGWSWPDARLLILGAVPGVALGAALYQIASADVFRVLIGVISVGFVMWQLAQKSGMLRGCG